MSILLVRHAESAANADWSFVRTTPDNRIPITEKGQGQARDVGVYLKEFFKKYPAKKPIRLWCSPYLRTTQTALGLLSTAGDLNWEKTGHGDNLFFDEMIRERQFGVLEGYGEEERVGLNKLHHEHWLKHKEHKSEYYVRPYGGESPADVTLRLRHFYGSLMRAVAEGVEDHVIVTHGIVIRSFAISFTRAHPDFFDKSTEIDGNTSVRLLDIDPKTKKYADYGTIYDPSRDIRLEEKPATPIVRDARKLV